MINGDLVSEAFCGVFFFNDILIQATIPYPQQIVRSCFQLVFRYLRSTQRRNPLPCLDQLGKAARFPAPADPAGPGRRAPITPEQAAWFSAGKETPGSFG